MDDTPYRIHTDKQKGWGVFLNGLNSMVNQVSVMLSHFSKVLMFRLDLRLDDFTQDSKLVSDFIENYKSKLRSEYKHKYKIELGLIGHIWCREQNIAHKQHYHLVILLNGQKVKHPMMSIEIAKIMWPTIFDARDISTPPNCFVLIKRNDEESIQKAIFRISYLAKVYTKDKNPRNSNDFSCSRIKHKIRLPEKQTIIH